MTTQRNTHPQLITAYLIGESSAGMTAVEIYRGSRLTWSHRWFNDGATQAGYINGLCDAYDCMLHCADVDDYDGGELDDAGDAVSMDDSDTTGVMLSYSPDRGWSLGDDARTLGQSSEIIDALMLVGVLPRDDEHDDLNDVVAAIATHINA